MSILSNLKFRRVRYPATLATSVVCLAEVSAWLIVGHWWLLVLPPATVGAVVVYRVKLRSSAKIAAERQRQLELRDGWATPLDMVGTLGYLQLRRQMRILRPSLAAEGRRWVPAAELGVRLVRSRGWLGRRWLYASVERSTAVIAPAGAGKSGWLLGVLLDAVGPAIVTSMKPDAISQTIDLRREVGPVYIFNPDGIGGAAFASTVRWDLLAGCEVPATAQQRAGYLMSGAGSATDIGEGDFWKSQGVRVLSVYLHAAALGGLPLVKVLDWVGGAQTSERMQRELRDLVGQSPARRTMLPDLEQWLTTNPNTSSSTTTTITQAVQWLSTDAGKMAQPGEGEAFDIDMFLAECGTLYLLAEDKEYGSVAPLFTAFVGWIYDQVKDRASKLPGGRLDPHLTMILDEITNICPVPMPKWAATMRGFNMAAHLGLQGPSQLVDKYGQNGARTILDNIFAQLYLAGLSDPKVIKDIGSLYGEVPTLVRDAETDKREFVRRSILSPQHIRGLKKGEALLVVHGLPGAATGTLEMYWERADYKGLQRSQRKAERKRKRVRQIEAGPERKAVEAVPTQRPTSDWVPTAAPVEQDVDETARVDRLLNRPEEHERDINE